VEREAALAPGETMRVGDYTLRFRQARLEADDTKRELYADFTVIEDGEVLGRVSPAKFIYRVMPDTPTTEVAIASTTANDLYVILNSYNPDTRVATMKVIVRPFVMWIWIAGLVLIFGAFVAFLPTAKEVFGEERSFAPSRGGLAAAALLLLVFGGAMLLAVRAHAQDDTSSSLHAGAVTIRTPHEQEAFERLLCNCGDCQRLPLSACACSTADERRAEVRASLARGDTVARIVESYRARFGSHFIAVPSDKGLDRALWAVPVGAIVVAAGGLVWLGRRWAARGTAASAKVAADAPPKDSAAEKALDEALDDELRRLGDG
jgi:cytochrome c-type biogenesis protein CcmF